MLKIVRFFCLLLCLFTHTAIASHVAINSTDARAWANSKGQELLMTLSETNPIVKYSKLDKMMEEYVNLDYISQFVIGKYGKLMSQEQKERYRQLFHRYALSIYKKFNLNISPENINFSIEDVAEHPRFTTVLCSIDAGDIFENVKIDKIPVKFKLIRGLNNAIQAVDVEISDVSMVIEYRKRFYQMIKDEDEDINWFLDKFADKVIANEKAFQHKAEL